MQTTDTINYEKFGFDGDKYVKIQSEAILDRISKFKTRLYLEIGWKFLYDTHASRVLPGFFVDSKKKIFSSLKDKADIIFCMNAIDLKNNRQLSSEDIWYKEYCLSMINDIKKEIGLTPKVSLNRVNENNKSIANQFKDELENLWIKSYLRYDIAWYPSDTKKVLSETGYGSDDYIEVEKDLVLVTWAASSSWKMSTCLGQIYHEVISWKDSGYSKYETFPIWNRELSHPVNLAYEAATADIWDYNAIDTYHEKAYGEISINYNRDVEAFEIVRDLADSFLPEDNFTRSYKSPTDMGINMAWFCITDEQVVKKACEEEIDRRYNWYKEVIDRWDGDSIWLERCDKLKERL